MSYFTTKSSRSLKEGKETEKKLSNFGYVMLKVFILYADWVLLNPCNMSRFVVSFDRFACALHSVARKTKSLNSTST